MFLLPTRALVNEQYARFSRTYGPVGLQTIRATGETADDVPALLRGQFGLAVLTYEKFAGLALGNPHLLKLISVVVIDEVQTIVDPGRGAYLEFLLTALKARRPEGVAPQVVALSAVLGATSSWSSTSVPASPRRQATRSGRMSGSPTASSVSRKAARTRLVPRSSSGDSARGCGFAARTAKVWVCTKAGVVGQEWMSCRRLGATCGWQCGRARGPGWCGERAVPRARAY